jgi:hypothetical protein
MGTAASKSTGSAASAGGKDASSSKTDEVVHKRVYVVEPLKLGDEPPPLVAVRIDPEALVMLNARDETVFLEFPFHHILCWGHVRTFVVSLACVTRIRR